MKIIYQQLLGFFIIIVTIISISGIAFSQLTKRFIYDDAWDSLEKLCDTSIQRAVSVSNDGKNVKFSLDSLSASKGFAKIESSNFLVYDQNKQIVYSSTNTPYSKINSSDWKYLNKKQVVKKVNDQYPNTSTLTDSTNSVIEVLKPYYYNNKLIAIVSASTLTSRLNSKIEKINNDLIRMFAIAIIVAMVISFIIANRLNRRIQTLRNSANEVARGNYEIKLKSKDKDEIDDLIVDFNNMTQSLKDAQNEIERQEKRRDEFLANAAHEMRTPLTTINGILEGLKYGVIPNEAKDHSFDLMMDETRRLIRLVNENLDYEKIRTNSIGLHKSEFDAVNAINNIVDQLSDKALASQDQIEINLPNELKVFADYDRFVQILVNIITNAIQFTENGTIILTGERGDNETIFKVADSGIGMTKEQIQNIFERYYKADDSRSITYGESGLGLAIVHQLVEQHQGTIKVDSELGKGTTFIVTFPDNN